MKTIIKPNNGVSKELLQFIANDMDSLQQNAKEGMMLARDIINYAGNPLSLMAKLHLEKDYKDYKEWREWRESQEG